MSVHIHDSAGVSLRVEYAIASDGVLIFHNIKVLDADYRPVGPDLTPLLHTLLVLTNVNPPQGEHFLSTLVAEIQHDSH